MHNDLHQRWLAAGITNDLIFAEVMRQGNNCRGPLRAILSKLKINSAQWLNSQEVKKNQYYQIKCSVVKIRSLA